VQRSRSQVKREKKCGELSALVVICELRLRSAWLFEVGKSGSRAAALQRHAPLRKKNQRRFSLRATRLTDFFAEVTALFAEPAAFLAFF
jgi:hypothetical protein